MEDFSFYRSLQWGCYKIATCCIYLSKINNSTCFCYGVYLVHTTWFIRIWNVVNFTTEEFFPCLLHKLVQKTSSLHKHYGLKYIKKKSWQKTKFTTKVLWLSSWNGGLLRLIHLHHEDRFILCHSFPFLFCLPWHDILWAIWWVFVESWGCLHYQCTWSMFIVFSGVWVYHLLLLCLVILYPYIILIWLLFESINFPSTQV